MASQLVLLGALALVLVLLLAFLLWSPRAAAHAAHAAHAGQLPRGAPAATPGSMPFPGGVPFPAFKGPTITVRNAFQNYGLAWLPPRDHLQEPTLADTLGAAVSLSTTMEGPSPVFEPASRMVLGLAAPGLPFEDGNQ